MLNIFILLAFRQLALSIHIQIYSRVPNVHTASVVCGHNSMRCYPIIMNRDTME
jgi:hypothetical protein